MSPLLTHQVIRGGLGTLMKYFLEGEALILRDTGTISTFPAYGAPPTLVIRFSFSTTASGSQSCH